MRFDYKVRHEIHNIIIIIMLLKTNFENYDSRIVCVPKKGND